jgi:hypothetical protein
VLHRTNGRLWLHYLRCKPGRGSRAARPGTDDIRNLVRHSDDDAGSFPVERPIAAEPAAYSDLAALGDDGVGVLWERGNYGFIAFTRLDRTFLESRP